MIIVALLTLACFLVSNIASTLMVQAESRNRAVMSGVFEALYALFWIVAAKYSVNTLNGHDTTNTIVELVALVAGNFLGAWVGVTIGKKFVTDHDDVATKERLAETEAALALAHRALDELEDEIEMHHELDEETRH